MNKSVSQATYILVGEERLVSKCRRDEGGGGFSDGRKEKDPEEFLNDTRVPGLSNNE